MTGAYICDALRTPFGKYAGALSSIRTDDLAALPIRALMQRNKSVDWAALDVVIYGCANQAGEDNRNVARMAALLAGLPVGVPATTVNRLCGSSMDAVATAARAIQVGHMDLVVAGGVESMSRAPFVLAKSETSFGRDMNAFDTTIGWRFINPALRATYGVDSMPETAENVAEDFHVSRSDQDAFALRSQQRWARANREGFFRCEIIPVEIPQKKGPPKMFETDEHPRPDTTLEALSKLKPVVKPNGTVTAGNASGINDGAAALRIGAPGRVDRQPAAGPVRALPRLSAAFREPSGAGRLPGLDPRRRRLRANGRSEHAAGRGNSPARATQARSQTLSRGSSPRGCARPVEFRPRRLAGRARAGPRG